MDRRSLLIGLGLVGCRAGEAPTPSKITPATRQVTIPGRARAVREVVRLSENGASWQTFDPFLFCVHHEDHYPRGNERLGPAASLAGRELGRDFAGKDGWRMYHGDEVPGFPRHPHRGFETVTVTRRGYIDHSDSLGATARYGEGDVQWMTAGRGIVHAEMFPLLDTAQGNPTELFQIWLNLPRARKMVDPHFSMFWQSSLPERVVLDADGRETRVAITAGSYDGATAPRPPPSSWAADADADVAIWTLKLAPGARFVLPRTERTSARTLYFFRGQRLEVDRVTLDAARAARLASDVDAEIVNLGTVTAEALLLQGRPIGERVVQRGPFVMNDEAEIEAAFRDYRQSGFGGWPWRDGDPVHPRGEGRFAVHADGRVERAG